MYLKVAGQAFDFPVAVAAGFLAAAAADFLGQLLFRRSILLTTRFSLCQRPLRFGRQPQLPDWVMQGAIIGLKEGARSSGGARGGYLTGALVVFQFTLAVVLLSGAGLMIRSFLKAQDEFSYLQPDQVLHARWNSVARR